MSSNLRPEAVDALSRLSAGPTSADLGPYLQLVEELRRLAPFTTEESQAGQSLGMEISRMEGEHADTVVAIAYYIWREAPGATISEGMARLSEGQFEEFMRVASGEISLDELCGEGGAA